jgi:hypothetical protein
MFKRYLSAAQRQALCVVAAGGYQLIAFTGRHG